MAFLRNKSRDKFTVVDNVAVRDDSLSLKALGLLVKLLSMPDDWEFSEKGLDAVFKKDGQASIRSGLKELEDGGYLKRSKLRDSKGRIIKIEWSISETPQLDYPQLENPSLDNPNLENHTQLNTIVIKDYSNKELNNRHTQTREENGFIPPSVDDVEAYCKDYGYNVDAYRFVNYYEGVGWMVGSTPMADWKAVVRNWHQRDTRKSSKRDHATVEIPEQPRTGEKERLLSLMETM